MQELFFTAGPSQLHPLYKEFFLESMSLNLGSINHRSEKFRSIYSFTDSQLKKLLSIPQENEIYFAAGATEIWERLLLNLVEKESYHFVNGDFSKRFYSFSKQLKKQAKLFETKNGTGFNFQEAIISSDTELICTTQNETSTGVFIASEKLHQLKKNNPEILICSDLVSVAPISNIDYSLIDSTFFSAQKAFGMPPGLGVWVVNKACIQKADKLKEKLLIGAHHTVNSFSKNYQNWETPSTPNIVAIYILGKIAENYNQIGIKKIQKESKEKYLLLENYIEDSNELDFFVQNKSDRSETILVLETKKNSKLIVEELAKHKIYISIGYNNSDENQIRIANFPTTTLENIQRLIATLEKIN